MSNTHIIIFEGGIKRRPEGDETMITLTIGLLASAIYGWWTRRHGDTTKS